MKKLPLISHKHIVEWHFNIAGIMCSIVKWGHISKETGDVKKPTWNFYIHIFEDALIKDFYKLLVPYKRDDDYSTTRYYFQYHQLEEFSEMHGGITFYDVIRNDPGAIVGIKVGCDFNHSGDPDPHSISMEYVYQELSYSVRCFLDRFPKCLRRCCYNGKYYKLEDGVIDNEKFRSHEGQKTIDDYKEKREADNE